jgi:WD40 repeat protein
VTITPTPAGPLNTNEAWLLFLARKDHSEYLWAVNQDGTGLTQLSEERVLTFAVQPGGSLATGGLVAYATWTDEEGPSLKFLSLPDREIQTVIPLGIRDSDDDGLIGVALEYGGLAWSPDGRYLAFVGEMAGTSDVYRYDSTNGNILQLTSGPDQAYGLQWSPDGRYILHKAFDQIGMGGPFSVGYWSARSDGTGVVTLFDDQPVTDIYYRYSWQGWRDSSVLTFYRWSYDDDYEKAGTVNVATGEVQYYGFEQVIEAAYSPPHNVWLLVIKDDPDSEDETLRLVRGNAVQDYPVEGDDWQIEWSETADTFLAQQFIRHNPMLISADGEVTDITLPDYASGRNPGIIPSPDGTRWAWHGYYVYESGSPVFVGAPLANPRAITPLDDYHIKAVTWSPDSQRLFLFTYDDVWMATSPDFNLEQISADLKVANTDILIHWFPGE